MAALQDLAAKLLRDPRLAELLQNPGVQRWMIRALRMRGRAQGAFDRRVQRVADVLSLATQRDVRALHRRIRELERELRETEERLIDAVDTRAAPDRIDAPNRTPRPTER